MTRKDEEITLSTTPCAELRSGVSTRTVASRSPTEEIDTSTGGTLNIEARAVFRVSEL